MKGFKLTLDLCGVIKNKKGHVISKILSAARENFYFCKLARDH